MKSIRDSVGFLGAILCGMTAIAASVVPLQGAEGVEVNRESDQWAVFPVTGVDATGRVVKGEYGLISIVFSNTASAVGHPGYAAVNDVLANSVYSFDVFKGDFTQIDSIAFKIKRSVVANNQVQLGLATPSTHPVGSTVWMYRQFDLADQPNQWVIYQIPLRYDAGWTNDYWGAEGVHHWDEISNVTNAFLRISRVMVGEHTVDVDRFILVGSDFANPPGRLVLLGDDLRARFGKTRLDELTAAERAADSDKDGMADVNEILAGTDYTDANSAFKVEVVDMGPGGVTIRWNSVPGGIYTVKRAEGIGPAYPFSDRPDGVGLEAGSQTTMTYTDASATGTGPYFYKVTRD